MEQEHLIQLVQVHPVLYDTSNEYYMRGKMKYDIWDKIAKELNYTSGQMAKEQWKKLRDCFRDALRRQARKRSGKGAVVVRPWIYQKQMAFLIPHMNNRNTSSNVSGTEGAASTLPAEVDEELDNLPEEIYGSTDVSVTDLEEQENSEEPHSANKWDNNTMETCCSYEARKRCRTGDESRDRDSVNESPDPLRQFFMAMYNTTKHMPLSYQLGVKRKVFDAVSQAEEDIISSSRTSQQSSSPSGPSSSMSLAE